ncbi:hypothetical protein [uncultured Albimonas sp.]|uniref:hypothetical protein n=1 Tax=uncultured Albimonas sp. TaxID=1331701 RepID=UPI0030ED084A
MFKLSRQVGDDWRPFSHPPVFAEETLSTGDLRLCATVPGGDPQVAATLVEGLEGPFQLLYVLHTPRGEGAPGRYQSEDMEGAEVQDFLRAYADLLRSDGRFDLWIRAEGSGTLLVWDRHDHLFVYGALSRAAERLRGLGFADGVSPPPVPHAHHYRAENDAQAARLLASRSWRVTPLHPGDE